MTLLRAAESGGGAGHRTRGLGSRFVRNCKTFFHSRSAETPDPRPPDRVVRVHTYTASAQHLRWTVPRIHDKGVSVSGDGDHVDAERRKHEHNHVDVAGVSTQWPLHPADGATTGGGAGIINCGHGYISDIQCARSIS